jgi:hypothetical protein
MYFAAHHRITQATNSQCRPQWRRSTRLCFCLKFSKFRNYTGQTILQRGSSQLCFVRFKEILCDNDNNSLIDCFFLLVIYFVFRIDWRENVRGGRVRLVKTLTYYLFKIKIKSKVVCLFVLISTSLYPWKKNKSTHDPSPRVPVCFPLDQRFLQHCNQ